MKNWLGTDEKNIIIDVSLTRWIRKSQASVTPGYTNPSLLKNRCK
jgi:hypothetical protein